MSAKCTAIITTEIVRVEIWGQHRESSSDLPMTPDDNDVIDEFTKWRIFNGIQTVVQGGETGGGRHIGYYSKKDAQAIEEWLKNNPKVQQIINRRICIGENVTLEPREE